MMHDTRAYQRCIRSVSAASRGTSPVLVSVLYQDCIRNVSGVYQPHPGRVPDTCIRCVSAIRKDAWNACVSEVYQECISSLEGHLPRPGISVGLAVYQDCIRSVSGRVPDTCIRRVSAKQGCMALLRIRGVSEMYQKTQRGSSLIRVSGISFHVSACMYLYQ